MITSLYPGLDKASTYSTTAKVMKCGAPWSLILDFESMGSLLKVCTQVTNLPPFVGISYATLNLNQGGTNYASLAP